jgi:hypothetical protein
MNFGKAFTFVFDDPEWLRKVAINALIGLIPIVGQLYLLGWGLEVARRVAMRTHDPAARRGLRHLSAPRLQSTRRRPCLYGPDVDHRHPNGRGHRCAGNATLDRATADTWLQYALQCVRGGLLMVVYSTAARLCDARSAYPEPWSSDSIKPDVEFGEVLALVRAAPGAYRARTARQSSPPACWPALLGGLACGSASSSPWRTTKL